MIEPAMYLAIGFLFAALLGVILIPLVHNRAVRLTMRRLEASTPLSMAEIQADKDQLRAEFAMSTRRLEMSVEQMKAKTTSQLAEIGKKTDVINRLKADLGDKTSTIFGLEAREKALKEQLRATEEEYSVKTTALRETERTLSDKVAELSRVASDLDERSATADSQKIELVALKTQIEALRDRIGDYEREIKETSTRLDHQRIAASDASTELSNERSRVENLGKRVGTLEQQLAAQIAEAQALSKRAQEMDTRIGEQSRQLTERESECDRLRGELNTSRGSEADLRAKIAAASQSHKEAVSGFEGEKSLLEKELERSKAERQRLQNEIAAMKREAEASWASERVENALLRERINDVAAQIAQMTSVLEGPNSPIEQILAADSASAKADPRAAAAKTATGTAQAKGNLAERMRALQARASRLPSTT
jgi:chromosome segregation ATPase